MAQTYNRQQVREMIARRGLGVIGQTDGNAADATRIRDATRLGQITRDTNLFGEAYVRMLATPWASPHVTDNNNDDGYVGKVSYVDPSTGDMFVSPNTAAAGNSGAIQTGKNYEVWKYGIWPDDVDRAIDEALSDMCKVWRIKPLSLFKACEEWATAAYSGAAGGVTSAAMAVQAMGFPSEWFEKSILVTNSGTNGYCASESEYVQPQQAIRIFGMLSVRSGTAAVRVRDITNGADIPLNAPITRTLRGWTFFIIQGQVPAGCQEVQIWAGGQEANCVTEWAGMGLLQTNVTQFTLAARVRNEHEVGTVFAVGPNLISLDFLRRFPIYDVHRERAGSATRIWTDTRLSPGYGVYYEEAHHYAPFCTPAPGALSATTPLTAAGFLTKSDRYTGDAASTDCDLRYVEAAATKALLDRYKLRNPELAPFWDQAYADLRQLEETFGPPQEAHIERDSPSAMRVVLGKM